MRNNRQEIVVVGCQSGDEGKGKFTDLFAEHADFVVRYQGGPNTGHTVNVDGKTIRFIQLPSGLMHGCKGVIGNGCVIDPVTLLEEIAALQRHTKGPIDLAISEAAHVIFPYHRLLDRVMEQWRGDSWAVSGETGFATGMGQLGTTAKGVGPCREDKIARIGLRMVDLLDESVVRNKLPRLIEQKRRLIAAISGKEIESLELYDPDDWKDDRIVEVYLDAGRQLRENICDVGLLLAQSRQKNARIIHEGAQSFGLDLEHGSYPFCSSGYSAALGVTVGTGTPLRTSFKVFGVVKAYMSQSGGGPLPSKMASEPDDYVVERGNEFGTVTGRRRRVGWMDLPFIRRGLIVDGISHLCVSCLDVLAGLPEVRVCTTYEIDGTEHNIAPARLSDLSQVKPVFTTLPGWPAISRTEVEARGFSGLPDEAKSYLRFLARELGVDVEAIGIGPERRDVVLMKTMKLWE